MNILSRFCWQADATLCSRLPDMPPQYNVVRMRRMAMTISSSNREKAPRPCEPLTGAFVDPQVRLWSRGWEGSPSQRTNSRQRFMLFLYRKYRPEAMIE